MANEKEIERKIYYGDRLEWYIADALKNRDIEFAHESENKAQGLDFYLPKYDVYIEVKRFHADRISRQMAMHENVIAIQGIDAVKFFLDNLKMGTLK